MKDVTDTLVMLVVYLMFAGITLAPVIVTAHFIAKYW